MGGTAAEADRTLFVGNLDPKVTEELIFELFHQAGPVIKVKIPKDKDGKQKQFAFVSFKHEESVPYGMNLLNGIKLYGRPINIQFRSGNSVHADKKFLDKYMPQFMRHLHYRIIDVSTVKELCRRWYPEEYEFAPKKAASHRALDDIRESIKELQFYRDSIFKRKTDEKKRKLIENGESDKTAS